SFNSCEDDEPDPYKDEYESNNSRTEATEYTMGQILEASIAKGDEDWYSFTPENITYIDIILIDIQNKSTDLEIVATLYDSQGGQIGILEGDPGQDLLISLSTRNGSYYIKISDKSGEIKGDYTLQISNTDANDNNEPDDTFAQAQVISSYPNTINGTILVDAGPDSPYGDWEYFLVLVKAGKRVDFSADPGANDMELHFKIYNEDQSLADEGKDGTDGETLNFYLNNGTAADVTLYIELGGYIGESYNGDYTISFTETTATKGIEFGN
ncbi:MAG: hypothetical protein JSV24_09810, partial [Bacteroidales bacterium]